MQQGVCYDSQLEFSIHLHHGSKAVIGRCNLGNAIVQNAEEVRRLRRDRDIRKLDPSHCNSDRSEYDRGLRSFPKDRLTFYKGFARALLGVLALSKLLHLPLILILERGASVSLQPCISISNVTHHIRHSTDPSPRPPVIDIARTAQTRDLAIVRIDDLRSLPSSVSFLHTKPRHVSEATREDHGKSKVDPRTSRF